MFSTCSELTPRAPIPDGRMAQFMQPCGTANRFWTLKEIGLKCLPVTTTSWPNWIRWWWWVRARVSWSWTCGNCFVFTIGQGCAAFSKSRNILLFALQLFMTLPLIMDRIEIKPLESVLPTRFTGKRFPEINSIQSLVWLKVYSDLF